MSKYSVKKPFTVLVAVIMVLVLGVVSLTGMPTDLLPAINLPYLIVVTTYPGASPEKVESDLTQPLESALGTVNGVENVTSTSNENYSLVMLEFAQDTDMDSAMVKASTALNQLADTLPELAGTPSLIEMSPDMMATQYVAVDCEGMDIYGLSDYTQNTVVPALERVNGVASVSASGLVEKTVEVNLQQGMIDQVNDKLLVKVSDRLADAKQKLEEAQAELDDSAAQLADGKKQVADGKTKVQNGQTELADQQADTTEQLAEASQKLDEGVAKLSALEVQIEMLGTLQTTLTTELNKLTQQGGALAEMNAALANIGSSVDKLVAGGQSALDELQKLIDAQQTATAESAALPPQILAKLQEICDMGYDQLKQLSDAQAGARQLQAQLAGLPAQLAQLQGQKATLEQNLSALREAYKQLEAGKITAAAGFGSGSAQLAAALTALQSTESQLESGQTQLDSGRTQLQDAWEEYYTARDEALRSANLDQLLNRQTLAQLLGAQNFSMPAGYIQDGTEQYLLKVGEPFESVDELNGALLCHVDGVGDVRLSDVATVTLTDNAGESYAKVNKNQAILLSIYKGSTASTSEVSDACNAAMAELMQRQPGLRLTSIMDQGDYIRLIVNSVVSNLLWGAVLAIVVLALFLKDVRPTLVVAISIPLSVLFAIVLMYFTGITLNMISLSGLALGIGMLVDNSIVVIENIYRLRARGVAPARAAVQGARQVAGAIVASTLTTICVFLPLVFTEGLTRELLSDMALTIAYSLLASLVVALTVVPCAGSTLLKKATDKKHPLFDAMTAGYEKLLRWCLRHKAAPLVLSVVLLAGSMWQLARMGLVLIPEISSNQLSVTVKMDENLSDADAFALADTVMDRLMAVDGIETVGAMAASGTTSAFMGMAGGETDNTDIAFYLVLNEAGGRNQSGVKQAITAGTADLGCEITVSSGSAMDMSVLSGSGVQVDIYGQDLDTLLDLSNQVADGMAQVPGITEVSNGQEAGAPEVRVVVDKDKAMRLGLTVAQIYSELAQALTTDTTSTQLTVGADTYTVEIIDTTKTPDLDGIFNYEFETTATDEDGKQTKETHTLGEFASRRNAAGVASIGRENQSRMISVTSATAEGYNTTLLSRKVQQQLDALDLPEGYTAAIGGETTQVDEMLVQMAKMMALALVLIYLVMVAQFQSLLSPFIVLFTIPLAFTGGALGLLAAGESLSLMSLMGFLVLMGVVVNNGIVFVDYTNQLRLGGLARQDALIATGKTRMRPILMTALTTILAMVTMLFSSDPGSEMGRGMAIVIIGGLLYATLMTLFIVPVIYDVLFRKAPINVDVGGEELDDVPDDAAEFAAAAKAEQSREESGEVQS